MGDSGSDPLTISGRPDLQPSPLSAMAATERRLQQLLEKKSRTLYDGPRRIVTSRSRRICRAVDGSSRRGRVGSGPGLRDWPLFPFRNPNSPSRRRRSLGRNARGGALSCRRRDLTGAARAGLAFRGAVRTTVLRRRVLHRRAGAPCSLSPAVLHNVHAVLKPGGVFGFTADDAASPNATSWRHELARRMRPLVPEPLRPRLDARLHEFRIDEQSLVRMLRNSPFGSWEWRRRHSPTGRVDFVVIATAVPAAHI
jgi:hypothetical protein